MLNNELRLNRLLKNSHLYIRLLIYSGILLIYQLTQKRIIDLWQIYRPKYFHPPTSALHFMLWLRGGGESVRGRFSLSLNTFLKNCLECRIIFYWPIDFDWFRIYWMIYDVGGRRGWCLMDLLPWMDEFITWIPERHKNCWNLKESSRILPKILKNL